MQDGKRRVVPGRPRDPDNYFFERGAGKASGGDGWEDVWKRGHFGWENKRPGRDLRAALKQFTDYTPAMPDEEILRRLLAYNWSVPFVPKEEVHDHR